METLTERKLKTRCMRYEDKISTLKTELIESKNAQGDLHLRILQLKQTIEMMEKYAKEQYQEGDIGYQFAIIAQDAATL